MYWRARQHPSWIPKSQQTHSRDILIIPPINNKASQHFFRPLHSPCLSNLHRPRRSTVPQRYHLSRFMVGQMIWGRKATAGSSSRSTAELQFKLWWHYTVTSALSPPRCLFDIYFPPVQRVGNDSQQPGFGRNTPSRIHLDLCFRRHGTGGDRAPEMLWRLISVSLGMWPWASHLCRLSFSVVPSKAPFTSCLDVILNSWCRLLKI